MITSISGKIIHIDTDSVVVEVGGIGFRILVPSPTRDHLHLGEACFLHTQLIVRQDALTLYGFDTKEGCEFFQLVA